MLDLTDYTIFDMYGVERLNLDGFFSPTRLANHLVEQWIPYLECHKCGKSSYCKYAEEHPHNADKKREIKCGVAEAAIRNFVDRTFDIAGTFEHTTMQAYLDGAFYFMKFVLKAEQSIGDVIDRGFLDWVGESAPAIFGRLTRIRDILNNLAQCFRQIPAFDSARSLLLVEGWAGKAFLDKLRESRLLWFSDLLVECYEGTGNRLPKRIAMLLQNYVERGYTIFAQGDADGRPGEIFKGLLDAGNLKQENMFVFAYDFESAVPPALLLDAMRRIGMTITFKPSVLMDAIISNPRSVIKVLLDDCGVDIRSSKKELAKAVAEILNDRRWVWWQDDKFLASELGRFLTFICRIR